MIMEVSVEEVDTMMSPARAAKAVVTGAAAVGEMVRGVAAAVCTMVANPRRQGSWEEGLPTPPPPPLPPLEVTAHALAELARSAPTEATLEVMSVGMGKALIKT